VGECDLELRHRSCDRPTEQTLALVFRRKFGHTRIREQLGREGAVFVGDGGFELLFELVGVEFAHAFVFVGDDGVDRIRLVADVLVDPLALLLEFLGREADRTQHAESSGFADRNDDVTAVGEGEDRNVDSKDVANVGVHLGLPVSHWPRGGQRFHSIPIRWTIQGRTASP